MKSSKRILHIINDEKFIEDADQLFNMISSYEHHYAIIGKRQKLKNLKSLNVIFINPFVLFLGLRLNYLKQFDAYIFHGLKGIKFKLIEYIEDHKKILWIGWGYDYYSLIKRDRDDFLMPETFNLKNEFKKSLRKKKSLKKKFLRFFEPSLEHKLELLKKVDLFNTVVKQDHYIFRKALGNYIPDYIDWNYPILNRKIISSEIHIKANSRNFLIGNSAAITNNHLDAFLKISNSGFNDFEQIVCPLSYGGNRNYKEAVIKKGEQIFRGKFKPLNDFYPAEEYFEILSNCKYYFSPTIRQQAFGNILLMLYLGTSIILNSENPVYKSLKEMRFYVFSAEDMENDKLRGLTLNEQNHNKRTVLENFSEEALLYKSENLLKNLTK